MLKPNEIIRTEKHRLQGAPAAHADCARMIDQYRRLVRVLCGIVFVNLAEINRAPSKCFAAERLFHATKDHPTPRYRTVDDMFHKFPSYLRRAAIEAAVGAVNSFCSNYRRWQAGLRSRRHAKPPVLARFLEVNPPLYGGQCIQVSDDYGSVTVKVLRADGQWGWSAPMKVRGRLKRLAAQDGEAALSPSLLIKKGQAMLAWPVKKIRPAWPGGDAVCAVDLGINTAATCAIVDSAGTVRKRCFIKSARHNDRLDKLAAGIRARANHTLGPKRLNPQTKKMSRRGTLGKGFCRTLYRRVGHLNRHVAQEVANAILAFALHHGATSLVFEHLKGWRPKGKGAGLKVRFHRWLHRMVVKRVSYLAEEAGIKVAFVAPRGTSSWAYDGSGEVVRSKENYSLARFASGKQYNADLNAALNIAARFIAKMLGVSTGDRPAALPGKSPGIASRMPIVLADIWRHAGAPV